MTSSGELSPVRVSTPPPERRYTAEDFQNKPYYNVWILGGLSLLGSAAILKFAPLKAEDAEAAKIAAPIFALIGLGCWIGTCCCFAVHSSSNKSVKKIDSKKEIDSKKLGIKLKEVEKEQKSALLKETQKTQRAANYGALKKEES